MRLVYGAPPSMSRNDLRRFNERDITTPEEWARLQRERRERELFGVALFNLIAPACGEEPLP